MNDHGISVSCPACGREGYRDMTFRAATAEVPARKGGWFRRARPAVAARPARIVFTCRRCGCGWNEIPLCDRVPEEPADSADIEDRLEFEFDKEAVCHCGEMCNRHSQSDNHVACWNPDPNTRLLYDSRQTISRLRDKLAACAEELLARREGRPCSEAAKETDAMLALPDTPKD